MGGAKAAGLPSPGVGRLQHPEQGQGPEWPPDAAQRSGLCSLMLASNPWLSLLPALGPWTPAAPSLASAPASAGGSGSHGHHADTTSGFK